jgi:hypothetical protein
VAADAQQEHELHPDTLPGELGGDGPVSAQLERDRRAGHDGPPAGHRQGNMVSAC